MSELTEAEEKRFLKFMKRRGITNDKEIEEYRRGLIMVKATFEPVPKHIKLSSEIAQKEMKMFDKLIEGLFPNPWKTEDLRDKEDE